MATAFNDKTSDDFRLDRANVQKLTLTETGKTYVSVRPGFNTSVMINKDTSIVTLKGTNDFTKGGDVDNAVFSTLLLSEGADNYQKGHSAGLTGFELDVTTYTNDIIVRVLEYKVGR